MAPSIGVFALAWVGGLPGGVKADSQRWESMPPRLAQLEAPAEAREAESGTEQASTCVGCHRRKQTVQAFPTWTQDHFIGWYVGTHRRAGVMCEECHGGDAAAPDEAASHVGVRAASDSQSKIYYKNLPETCGRCHERVYKEFVRSNHYRALVRDRLAPSCTTCHGLQMDMGGVTDAIAERCAICHNTGQGGVKPEVAGEARAALDHVAAAQRVIEKTRLSIEFAREQGQDTSRAEALLRGAEERFDRTGSRWHRFRLEAFDRDLAEISAEAEKAQAAALGFLRSQ